MNQIGDQGLLLLMKVKFLILDKAAKFSERKGRFAALSSIKQHEASIPSVLF